MENITGKRALVTGGAKGLGKAIAVALAKEGVYVAITGRNETALKQTAAELTALGTQVTYAVFDVSDYEAVQQGIKNLNETFGDFDILINNAGISSFSTVMEMNVQDWTAIINVNLLGTYFVTKAVLPQLIEKNQGDIIMVSSTAGLNGAATTSAYSASKFGVIGFADSLMREVRKNNIRVCTLTPSTIASDMSKDLGLTDGDPEKVLQPEDFADLVIANLKLPRRAMLKSASLWSTNP